MLALLFIVPLVSLVALWAFAASVTLSSAIQERNYSSQNHTIGAPAEALGVDLTLERLQSFIWLSSGRPPNGMGPMLAQRKATSAAVVAFRRGVAAGQNVMFAAGRPTLARFVKALDGLTGIREAIDEGQLSPLAALDAYDNIVNTQYQLYNDLILVNNVPLYQQSVVSVEGGRALEMVGREIALVSGALAARGHMTGAEHAVFTQTVGQQRLLMGDVLSELNPDLRAGYVRAYTSPAHATFAALENRIIASTNPRKPIPVNPQTWTSVSTAFLTAFEGGAEHDRLLLAVDSAQVGGRLLRQVLLAGGLGLIAVCGSIFLMWRFGRRISQELTGLQLAAREMAETRLPKVVERLRRGEDIDVAAESPPLEVGRTTEIAKVAEAFSTVQRTAVQAAVGQAQLRKGISQVFLNLAWRSQSLLHRQLSVLDGMERRSTEPEALEDLFRLDHLTTRMRRHAEGLTILSGAASARGWRQPVPVIDVLRGAVAEVEDYTRVAVITQSRDGVTGAAVADVIHLLAELIENATAYSPPNTQVMITADRVANGFAIEIEDRGLGISHDELEKFNEQLANPPEFDLADSDQLGLFVVGRLAARHQMKVTLRPSPYGGTTAIVLLPHGIVVPERELFDDGGAEPVVAAAVTRALTSAGDGSAGGAHAAPGQLTEEPPTQPGGLPPWRWASEPGEATQPGQASKPPGDLASPPAAGLQAHDLLSQYLPSHDLLGPDLLSRGSPTASPPATPTAAPTASPPAGPAASPLESPAASPPPSPMTSPPARPDAAPATDEPGQAPGEAGPETAGTHLGLPRRVRQASLAPQLRDAPPPASAGPDTRSPADSRAFMASLQEGWERGRSDAVGEDGTGNADEAGNTGGHPEPAPGPSEREGR
jgi:signal transduction histidine kinase